jgi:hypothetical protein
MAQGPTVEKLYIRFAADSRNALVRTEFTSQFNKMWGRVPIWCGSCCEVFGQGNLERKAIFAHFLLRKLSVL